MKSVIFRNFGILKKIFILFIVVSFSFNCGAQSDKGLKNYGREVFEHFQIHDFDWLNYQLQGKHQSEQFEKKLNDVYGYSTEDVEIVDWFNVVIDKIRIERGNQYARNRLIIEFYDKGILYEWRIINVIYNKASKQYRILTPTVLFNSKRNFIGG